MRWGRKRARSGGVVSVAVVVAGLVATWVSPAGATPEASSQAPPERPSVTKTVLLLPDGREGLPVPNRQGGTQWQWPWVSDINDHGQIVGAIWTDLGEAPSREPLLWEDGQARATALPTDAGAVDDARRINDAGQILISREATSGFTGGTRLLEGGVTARVPGPDYPGYYPVAFNESGQITLDNDDGSIGLWEDGRATTVPPPTDAGGWKPEDLSDAGHIVGYSAGSAPIVGCPTLVPRPFIWHQGTMTRPSITGTAVAVNRSGQVLLTVSVLCQAPYDAKLWANGTTRDLGAIVYPVGINDRGQVVGQADGRSYLWENGRVTDLGSLGGDRTSVIAVNEGGQVIGLSRTAGGATHGFVWTSGHMLDLGPVGDHYTTYPQDINDLGQIIGYDIGDPSVPDDTTAVMWQVHDPTIPTDPSEQACVTATNTAHVQAGRATSVLLFTWAAGSGTYLGTTSQTTSLRETAPGRWELVDTC